MTGRKQRKDGLLHGTYEAHVEAKDGSVHVSEVASDWVLCNILGTAREILHRVSTEWNEQHADRDGRMETGYLTLEENDSVMKNGKETTVEYMLDDRQISKIRYLPARTITTLSGVEKSLPEKWRGLICGLNKAPDEFVWLEWEWIQKNMSEEFIGFIKSTRNNGVEGYVCIPEGTVEDHTQQMLSEQPHPVHRN
jgi:hypothetical protein